MSKSRKTEIKINPKKRTGHKPHRSGSGEHDSREKRKRTRKDIVDKEIDSQTNEKEKDV